VAAPAGSAAPAGHAPQAVRVTDVQVVRVADVQVRLRYRKELGNLTSLANSIRSVGLLHPIVITSDRQLIAGQRRLEAVKRLSWTEIPARVVDLENITRGEHDENVERKPFTPSEAVAIGRALEARERPKAAKRMAAHWARHGNSGKTPVASGSGNLPEPEPMLEDKGQTRDKVAAFVGMGSRTYEKAKAVVKAAEDDPERHGHLVEQMDQTGKVDPAYRQLTKQETAEGPPSAPNKKSAGPSLGKVARELFLFAGDARRLSKVRVAERDPAAAAELFRQIRVYLDRCESEMLAGCPAEGGAGHE
jgi:ParB family chromosome partitioning protein